MGQANDPNKSRRASMLARRIEPILRSEEPEIAGAALAELLAIYLVAHCVADIDLAIDWDATRQLRYDVMRDHIREVVTMLPRVEATERREAGHA